MAHRSDPRLLTLHGLRLKGIAEVDVVAETMGIDAAAVQAEIDQLEPAGLVAYRHGRISGYLQTPDGRAMGEQLLADEIDAVGCRAEIEDAYREFRGFNDQLLQVCTAWQLRDVDGTPQVNDHTDAGYDRGVHAQLLDLDLRIRPVLDRLASTLARFDGHRRRLQSALEHVLAGEQEYFTRPMFPSYHSIWFELHEDLLATLGTDRVTEGSS